MVAGHPLLANGSGRRGAGPTWVKTVIDRVAFDDGWIDVVDFRLPAEDVEAPGFDVTAQVSNERGDGWVRIEVRGTFHEGRR